MDDYGFLPILLKVNKGRVTDEIYLWADEEANAFSPADIAVDGSKIVGGQPIARIRGDFRIVNPEEIEYMDIAPCQMVGVLAN